MNLNDLTFANVQIDCTKGLPFADDADLANYIPWLPSETDPLVRHEKFWTNSGKAGLPFAKGLFGLPLSGLSPPTKVPSRKGVANWDSPNAEILVDNFVAVMAPMLKEDCLQHGDLREQVKILLSDLGLVSGTIVMFFPIGPRELAIWAVERDVERFVRRLSVEWIGLSPMESGGSRSADYRARWRRFQPSAFDLSDYILPAPHKEP